MCNKSIHTLSDFRKEMLRLKQKLGRKFEDDPEYKKTANCKENILSKEACSKFSVLPKTPKTKPNATRKKHDAYDDYKMDVKQYAFNMGILKGFRRDVIEYTKQRIKMEKQIDKLSTERTRNIKAKTALEEKNKRETYTKRIHEYEERNQAIEKEITQLQSSLKDLNLHYTKTVQHISNYERKTSVEPVPPTSFESDKKSCPKGYLRNKTTRRCEQH